MKYLFIKWERFLYYLINTSRELWFIYVIFPCDISDYLTEEIKLKNKLNIYLYEYKNIYL